MRIGSSILETSRLLIYPLELGDASFIFELMNEPGFLRFIGDRKIRDEETARVYLRDRMIGSYEEHGFGLYLLWLKSEQCELGICGFVKRKDLEHPELGFALLKEFEGYGYDRESSEALIEFARMKLGLRRLLAITSVDNPRSIRLCQKLGFVRECSVKLGSEPLECFGLTL